VTTPTESILSTDRQKFVTGDYVSDLYDCAKFGAIIMPPSGKEVYEQIGEI